ncbi:MAG: Uma2 family endonuclease [Cyanophyceae cyanobacterium]
MSPDAAELQSRAELADWEAHMPPTDLVFDDGEPLESNRHRIAMNVLIDAVNSALDDRSDFFAGGNMFVYYSRSQAMNRDFRGPDFFVALDVDGTRERQGWVVWEEEGRYPDVIVELLSPSTATVDTGAKKDLYERTFHTANYFVYDPFDANSLQGWQLDANQRYQPILPNENGWLWCSSLQLWLGTWEGQLRREPLTGTCIWLRFYDAEGNVVPLPEELAAAERQRADAEQQRADAERQRAERLAAQLIELGIDPENL